MSRAKEELEAERGARLDSEDLAARLREQLANAREEQDRNQRSAQEQLDAFQTQLQRLKVHCGYGLRLV